MGGPNKVNGQCVNVDAKINFSDEEEKKAKVVLSKVGYTAYDELPKGISVYNGVLVIKQAKQPEIWPAYKQAAVKKIQEMLIVLGLLSKDTKITGVYDTKTEKAVKKFQNMISAVGADGKIIGRQTLDALERAYNLCKSGDKASWQDKLIYVATGIELDPISTQVVGNPPNVEEMLVYMINQSGQLEETIKGKSTIYYQPEGTSQATKILKAALWIIGMDQRGTSIVYTGDILSNLINSAGGGHGTVVGDKALKVISKALMAAHAATVKGLDPYTRAEYIKNQVKGMWNK